jgi:hypothetical protein
MGEMKKPIRFGDITNGPRFLLFETGEHISALRESERSTGWAGNLWLMEDVTGRSETRMRTETGNMKQTNQKIMQNMKDTPGTLGRAAVLIAVAT